MSQRTKKDVPRYLLLGSKTKNSDVIMASTEISIISTTCNATIILFTPKLLDELRSYTTVL